MSVEAAVSYAAIILADSEVEITSDKLLALTSAAGIESVEPIWAQLFAKAVAGQNIKELFTSFAASSGPSVGGSASGAAGSSESGAAAEEEAAEEEAAEESDGDMGMGLFD